VNVARVSCDLINRQCEINQSEIKDVGGPTLDLDWSIFKVTQVDESSLTAVNTSEISCVRETLLIDRKAKAVSVVTAKISNEGLCQNVHGEPMTSTLVDGWKASALTSK
jgi:hypothetical protein